METIGERKSIIYEALIDVRFGDLDPYGHVNSANYLDYVSTSRLLFLERDMKKSVGDVLAAGYAWFLVKSEINYLAGIPGLRKLRVSSHVEEIQGPKLVIPFQIIDAENSKAYSKGILEFFTMDIKTRKPVAVPEWMAQMFFSGDLK